MRKEICNLFLVNALCVFMSVGSGAAETAPTGDLRTVQEKIQHESDRLTRLSVKLDRMEEDLMLRNPEIEKLKAELSVLEKQMQGIIGKIEGYQSGVEQFKKLSLEFHQIEAALKKLREQESSWADIAPKKSE